MALHTPTPFTPEQEASIRKMIDDALAERLAPLIEAGEQFTAAAEAFMGELGPIELIDDASHSDPNEPVAPRSLGSTPGMEPPLRAPACDLSPEVGR